MLFLLLKHFLPQQKDDLKMKIKTKDFRVPVGKEVDLKKWPTKIKNLYKSKKKYKKELRKGINKTSDQQELLYASNETSILIIFQAMDAAGKDSAIRHVMSGINPQGCQVFSFKHPSAKELDHDFLWRTTTCLPERGRIGIFNRSYYEEVLIARVHPEILVSERVPFTKTKNKSTIWKERYQSITDMETHLHRNGTRIIKFFLHLSKEEQRKRFIGRIDESKKNWKFSKDDLTERTFWNKYMHAYQDCLSATSSDTSPWYIVPADNKKNARLIISQVILETLQSLKMTYPQSNKARREELQNLRKLLEK
jgi:PPK2 family polyphosphate:nucleotide phosphotransferase